MMSTSRASRGSKDKSTKTHTAQKGPSQNVKPDPPTMTSKQIQVSNVLSVYLTRNNSDVLHCN